MRDLLPGVWTVLLVKRSRVTQSVLPGDSPRCGCDFRYACVRSNVRIPATPGDQPTRDEDLEVEDLRGFLQQTAPRIDPARLQHHFDRLDKRVPQNEPIQDRPTHVLSFLEADDARHVLDRFLENIPKAHEAIQRAAKTPPNDAATWFPELDLKGGSPD
ncbi:uncharacterized protein BJX67DRAFT_386439 [Aspergillus lucknowensis]|uniref:Uncharacterized protein n=1 Tax=Aspergillus lucknowensis TaxID=176173 RepID=A0ABR4L921_9EURO